MSQSCEFNIQMQSNSKLLIIKNYNGLKSLISLKSIPLVYLMFYKFFFRYLPLSYVSNPLWVATL